MADCRVISAEYGDQSVVLMFYKKSANSTHWTMDVVDADTKAVLQTIKTPFGAARDISKLSYVQSFDVVYFAEGGTYPCKLTRDEAETGGGYEWAFEDCELIPEPLLEWNDSSEHVLHLFAIPDADLVEVDEDGNRFYPKGCVRQYNADAAKSTLPHIEITGVSGGTKKTTGDIGFYIYFTFEAKNNFTVIPNTSVDISSLALTVQCTMYADGDKAPTGSANTGWKAASYLYGGRKEKTEDDYWYYGTWNVYPDYIEFTSQTEGRWCVLQYAPSDTYGTEAVSISDASFGLSYPSYTGYGSNFWVAKRDAPATAMVTSLEYYTPYTGGQAGFCLTIDGAAGEENIAIGDFIALKTKNTLYESGMLGYDQMPVGTTYPLQNPPVEVQEKLEDKTDSNGIQLRPESGGGYGYASDIFPIRGEVTFKTEGVWSGVLELQEYTGEGNLSTIATISSENGNSNTELTRDVVAFGSAVRVACVRRERCYKVNRSVNGEGGIINTTLECDEGCQWTLSSKADRVVYLRINEVRKLSDGTQAYIVTSYGGATNEFTTDTYALGAFGKKKGYPRFVGLFQERLFYAGTKGKPTTLWLSQTNDWGDFEDLGLDTSAISMTILTEKYDEICWVKPVKTGITVGTKHSEFIFGDTDGGVVTADNGRFTNTSDIGSSGVTPEFVGTALLMVKTGNEEVHRIDYNTLSEESAGTQISLMARHMFENDEIVDLFAVKSPTNTTFALTASGKLCALTYEPDYGVLGWGRLEVLDGILSACVFRRSGHDVIGMITKKGKEYVLGELDLQTEDVWLDDGERYESVLTPTPFMLGERGGYGSRLNIAGVDVYTTAGTEFYAKLSGGAETRVERGFDKMNKKLGLLTKTTLSATSGWEDEATITIRSDYPAPLEIVAIGVNLRKGG